MKRSVVWSILVCVVLVAASYALTGGRLVVGLFVFPLGLIPLFFRRRDK